MTGYQGPSMDRLRQACASFAPGFAPALRQLCATGMAPDAWRKLGAKGGNERANPLENIETHLAQTWRKPCFHPAVHEFGDHSSPPRRGGDVVGANEVGWRKGWRNPKSTPFGRCQMDPIVTPFELRDWAAAARSNRDALLAEARVLRRERQAETAREREADAEEQDRLAAYLTARADEASLAAVSHRARVRHGAEELLAGGAR